MTSLEFVQVQEDLAICVSDFLDRWDAEGNVQPDFSSPQRSQFVRFAWNEGWKRLTREYIAHGLLDPLIDYMMDQWDAGGGDDFLIPVTNKLVENGDSTTLMQMWTTVIFNRTRADSPDLLSAYQILLHALRQLGDTENYSLISREMEFVSTGRGPDLLPASKVLVTENVFWDLLEQSKENSAKPYSRSIRIRPKLEGLTTKGIKDFHKILCTKLNEAFTWDLWALAYLACGGCSERGFRMFRNWLVSEGKEVFHSAVAQPSSLVPTLRSVPRNRLQCENIEGAVSIAYVRRARSVFTSKCRSPKQPKGQSWTEEDLSKRYPDFVLHFPL